MSYYILIFGWLLLMLVFMQVSNSHRTEYVLERPKQCPKWFVAIMVFLPVIIWAGVRDAWIGDTGAYMTTYAGLPNTFGGLVNYLPEVNKDKGFTILSVLIKIIVGDNVVKYFLILAILQGMAVVSLYRKYSNQYIVSIFLFIASTDYLSWMFNGMRQFTAVSLIILATKWTLDKKYIKSIAVVLFASTMHGSALLVLPFIFLAQGKAWNRKTVLIIVGTIVIVACIDQFVPFLDTMLADTQYKNVVSDWESWNDNGTNAIRVFVYSLPTIISFIGRKRIQYIDDPLINFCTNMSIVSACLYVVSMFTSGIFIGRLPIFFSLYNYILLPWEIENYFERRSAQIITILMVVCYLGFYYFQVHFAWGLM